MSDKTSFDPFRQAAAFQSQFADLMSSNTLFKDFERAAELAARFQFPHLKGEGVTGPLPDIDSVRQSFEFLEKTVRPQFDLFTKYADWLKDSVKQDQFAKACVGLGLFPQFSVLQSMSDTANANSQMVFDHIHEQMWPHIKKELLAATERYGRVETNRTVLREAVTAHEAGLYHIVPPAIFTHVERACRHAMRQSGADGAYYDWLTQEIGARGMTGFGGMFTGMGVLDIYKRLGDSAFAFVENSEVAEQMQSPEKNQALHGQIQRYYKADSLNALLFGNYVFSALGFIEKKAP